CRFGPIVFEEEVKPHTLPASVHEAWLACRTHMVMLHKRSRLVATRETRAPNARDQIDLLIAARELWIVATDLNNCRFAQGHVRAAKKLGVCRILDELVEPVRAETPTAFQIVRKTVIGDA